MKAKWVKPTKSSSLRKVADDLRVLQRVLLEKAEKDAEMARRLAVQRMKDRG